MVAIVITKKENSWVRLQSKPFLLSTRDNRMSHSERTHVYSLGLIAKIHFPKTLLLVLNSAVHFKNDVPFTGFLTMMEGRTEARGSIQRCLNCQELLTWIWSAPSLYNVLTLCHPSRLLLPGKYEQNNLPHQSAWALPGRVNFLSKKHNRFHGSHKNLYSPLLSEHFS